VAKNLEFLRTWAIPYTIFKNLLRAVERAEDREIEIENMTALKTQVFVPSGTIHDGTTTAWESLAVGPDGKLYPSAALLGLRKSATDLGDGLADSGEIPFNAGSQSELIRLSYKDFGPHAKPKVMQFSSAQ
jgi:hypothetical protein